MVTDDLDTKIRQVIRDYMENTKEVEFGEGDGSEEYTDGTEEGSDTSEEGDGDELTPEEEGIMNVPDEGEDDDF